MKIIRARHALLHTTAVIAVIAIALSGRAVAQGATFTFDIPAESLTAALQDVAKISGKQIIFSDGLTAGKSTNGLRGSFTVDEAMNRLLNGTDLAASEASSGGIVVKSKNAQAASNEGAAQSQNTTTPETVVVTGTRIAGEAPVGSSVTTFTHEDIEKAGSATLDQFARLMPQNFSSADTIATGTTNGGFGTFGQGAQANSFGGSSFNLHGLGPAATLTLLNGHRLPAGGYDGSLTDISMIPLGVIDRVEVLDDGASAIYGSDAVAGVVNVITRKDFDGAQSRILYGAATDGGDGNITASQLFGKSWTGGGVLLSYEYNHQDGLDASQRGYVPSQGGRYSLMPENNRNSVFLSGYQDIDDATIVSVTGLFSNRDFHTDYTVNGTSEILSEPTSGNVKQYGGTVNIERSLMGDWHADVFGSYSEIDQSSATLETYDLPAFHLTGSFSESSAVSAKTTDFDASLTGTLFHLPSGDARAALGGSFRIEDFAQKAVVRTSVLANVSGRRQVGSAYGEVTLPIVSGDAGISLVRSLNVSAAVRYDDYNDFGSTTDYKLGFSWHPAQDLAVRGTYGTSFQAPLLANLHSLITSFVQTVADPTSPSHAANLLTVSGGNPALRPETAKVTSAGFDYQPASLPSLKISATFFDVAFSGEIQQPPYVSSSSALTQPILNPYIIRNPSLAQVTGYFNSPGFEGDFTGGGPGGVTTIFKDQYTNIAATHESGFDVSARYAWDTSYGQLGLSGAATILLQDKFRTAASAPSFELLNTFGEPTSWKLRGGPSWSDGGFYSSLTINYVNQYTNNLVTPTEPIGAWTTADFYIGYNFGADPTLTFFRNLNVALSVSNLTDSRPPFVQLPAGAFLPGQSPLPYDPTNASPVGRFISLQLTAGW